MNDRTKTHAIILCAGAGVRVAELTQGLPKSFLAIGDETLIQRQIRIIREAGITSITLVVGYQSQRFRETFPGCQFVENPEYRATNTSYSLALALQASDHESFLILNADVYYAPSVIEGVIEHRASNVAAVDRKRNGEEEIKVRLDDERITCIGKYVCEDVSAGEAFGVYKVSAQFARYLRRELLLQNNPKAFYERGIDQLLRGGHVMELYDIGDAFCMEIDTPEDYFEILQTLGLPNPHRTRA